ncbi:MAG TPA: dienelactone hydrolase family protein [Candidatus Dormibacteraeota bacterium]|jgi:predicted peptidase|nr:dienelactone hydrolase family protein [Candidatus Dormibacteraeota bacterium]
MTQEQARLTGDDGRVLLDYLVATPPDDVDRPWPLLLFLHGAGERGRDLRLVAKHGPPAEAASGWTRPFLLISPQCPAGERWTDHLEDLSRLIDEMERVHPVDPERIYLTGLSMGGAGTWAFAAGQPGRFAAAVPVCGRGDRTRGADYGDLPVWAFHGADDTTVPTQCSRQVAEAIEAAGGDVRLTIYEGVGHDSWTRAYATPELWAWLLEHRRSR